MVCLDNFAELKPIEMSKETEALNENHYLKLDHYLLLSHLSTRCQISMTMLDAVIEHIEMMNTLMALKNKRKESVLDLNL